MRLQVGQGELKNAFNAHCAASKEGTSYSHCLLLFYAVECGLKSIYYRKINNTSTIIEVNDSGGHDLLSWAKGLRLPPKITTRDPKFKLRRDGITLEVTKAHEAWRYGALINSDDETNLVNWLEDVKKWIEENIDP